MRSGLGKRAWVGTGTARVLERVRVRLAEITAINDLINNVFASIASGVITTNADDAVVILNDAACQILQADSQMSLGQIVWEALPRLHEDLSSLVQSVREHELEQSVEVETEIGERGFVNLNLKFSPLRNARQVTQGVAIVVDDFTEIKQREEQLSVVKRYLPPAMVYNIPTIHNLGLGGERREITTMFIDVRNFSTFPATLRPQELMKMLNAYLTIASDEVTKQNGVIDKYMANEIMGLFNRQLNPSDDHAWHAVQTA